MNYPIIRHGCVLEINSKEAIVMTNDGEFLTVPLKGKTPEIGEIIAIPDKSISYKKALPFLAAAAMLLLMLLPSMVMSQPVLWLSLDVNPSLELGLDKEQRVVETLALNDDAAKILKQVNIKKETVDSAIPKLLDEMEREKYIAPEKDDIVIWTLTEQGESQGEIQELKTNTLQKISSILKDIKEKKKVPLKGVFYTKAQASERKIAHAKKLSLGKYTIYKLAKSKGLDVKIDDLTKVSAAKAVYKAGGNLTQLFNVKRVIKDIKKNVKQQVKENKLKRPHNIQEKVEDVKKELKIKPQKKRVKENQEKPKKLNNNKKTLTLPEEPIDKEKQENKKEEKPKQRRSSSVNDDKIYQKDESNAKETSSDADGGNDTNSSGSSNELKGGRGKSKDSRRSR